MRSLAIARYRLLNSVRSSDWIFAIALACAAVPVAITGIDRQGAWFPSAAVYPFIARVTLKEASVFLVMIYIVQAVILMLSAAVMAKRPGTWGEVLEISDLLDTAPANSRDRFFGDTAGIASSLTVVHVATLPFLLLAGALSGLTSAAIAWLEVVLLALVVFASAGSAAQARVQQTRWGRTMSMRASASAALLAIGALVFTTRVTAFRDAAMFALTEPSPNSWAAVTAAVDNPLLLGVALCAVYAATIGYYYLEAVRPQAQP